LVQKNERRARPVSCLNGNGSGNDNGGDDQERGVMTVRHVVVWRLKGESSEEKMRAYDELAPHLEALVGVIPGLLSLSVSYSTGPNPNNWDMCLISDHESWDALDTYATHPSHLEVASRVAEATIKRAGADFELPS
jgi:hypothetical protein